MINYNLIIDSNYLLHKTVYVLYKNQILVSELYNVIERDFENLSKIYPFDKIYFISDSHKNWRKEIYTEYKGTRKKDEKIDWNFVFKEFNRLKEHAAKKLNCEIYEIEYLEADDLISYITKKLNDKGESVLIMSNDSDLLQLVNYDIDKRYMNIMYNFKLADETIYIPEHYNIFTKYIRDNYVDDIFVSNNEIDYLESIQELLSNKKVNFVNSEFELFNKIMGHNKDNIKSVYMKGDRGIGESGIEKVYQTYKETYPEPIDFNSVEFKNRLIDHIKLYKKLKDGSMDESIMERLNRNLILVKLDENSMPKHLYNNIKKEIRL